MRWVTLGVIFLGQLARAGDWGGYTLDEVGLEYRRFNERNHIPELFGRTANEGLAITLDSTLGSVGELRAYWKADVHALTDTGQYRLVGLLNELGLSWRAVSVSYEHHSQHLLDASPSPDHFPVQDALFLKLILFSK